MSSSESATTNVEQEKFFNSVVQATPSAFLKTGSSAWGMTESTLSIDSMLTTVDTEMRVHGTTPEQSRKSSNPFSKVMAGTLGYVHCHFTVPGFSKNDLIWIKIIQINARVFF